MFGVPLQMIDYKRLKAIVDYIFRCAKDRDAMCEVEMADGHDACGNRKVTIKITSRVNGSAARAILAGDVDGLFGFGTVNATPPKPPTPPASK
jgi:hypothetical protein